MAEAHIREKSSKLSSCDAYFEMVQSKRKLSHKLQDSLTAAFAKIPVSSFPRVPGGKVIEIDAETLIRDAVEILSESNILSAPVMDSAVQDSNDGRERYLGILDYSAIVLWVLENAETEAAALSANSIAVAGTSVTAAGALGALAMSATACCCWPNCCCSWCSRGRWRGCWKWVRSIVESYHWAPFIPVTTDSSMLSVLLLVSKYRLRSVPVIETGKPFIKNLITQSDVIQGLEECKGRDWLDGISALPISDLGLPYMSSDEVISIQSDELILEAFKKMRDNNIGGLPVVQGPKRKIVGNVSLRDIRFLLPKPELFSNFSKVATPITCRNDSTLCNVIDILVSKSVHRIYVTTGEDDEVVGVITPRDVISCFIFEPP
ncbi:unnamed protein product [Withania somnifera]